MQVSVEISSPLFKQRALSRQVKLLPARTRARQISRVLSIPGEARPPRLGIGTGGGRAHVGAHSFVVPRPRLERLKV